MLVKWLSLCKIRYEPVSLDVNEVCFHEEEYISNTREKNQEKSQSVTEWCICGKSGVMNTNVECLC